MDEESLLVRDILAGDLNAWHRFVETHETFLKRVIHQYVQDEELLDGLFVTLLEKLRKNKLRRFSGRSSLKTWLFIVAKNHCRDYFRSKSGIRHILSALEELEQLDRRFFKLFYMEHLSLREVHSSLGLEFGEGLSYIDLLECDERIRKRLAEKNLGNVPDKLLNPTRFIPVPLSSIRLKASGEPAERTSHISSELMLDSMELERALGSLKQVILSLPSKDQILLKLRFEHKLSARRISEVLDLANEKQVYRKLEKLFVRLERMLGDSGITRETYAELAANIETLSRYRDNGMESVQ